MPFVDFHRRTVSHGGVKQYSTWQDESLNQVLRRIGQHSHALTFDHRLFHSFFLIGHLGLCRHIFG